jgi:hypothetical protein
MKKLQTIITLVLGLSLMPVGNSEAQEVKTSNSKSWSLSGRVQVQHLYSDQFDSESQITNNGFRMRRVRLQTKAKVTPFLVGKIQFEIRDNNPNLKDAEGILTLFKNYDLRIGQFKVPVWRPEFVRSSGDLLLVERSELSFLLLLALLSGRQVGLEFGGKPVKQFSFAFNYSNGAGEGIHELTRRKSINVNNDKMYTGRIDYFFSPAVQIGVSVSANQLGNRIATFDSLGNNTGTKNDRGTNNVIAPDIGIYLPFGLEIETGAAFGTLSKPYLNAISDGITYENDIKFSAFDITSRFTKMLEKPNENLAGLNGWEVAAGISYIDNDAKGTDVALEELRKRISIRFGPAVYLGKKTRLQVNGEFVDFDKSGLDSITRIRSQITVNL